MSRISIFGGTGYAGSHIAREARSRGHEVASYSRTDAGEHFDGIDYRQGSIADVSAIKAAAQQADELVVAVHGADIGGQPLIDVVPALIEAAEANQARLSFVGGAGSSLVSPEGPRLLDTPEFNDDWKPEALSHAEVLGALRQHPGDLDWFYVSPAGLFGAWAPGEDTGSYRTGDDVLVTKEDGSSEISGTDFARAYVDEIEQRRHVNRRFTVGH